MIDDDLLVEIEWTVCHDGACIHVSEYKVGKNYGPHYDGGIKASAGVEVADLRVS